MQFPHEAVPDGAALAPHHATLGFIIAALACAVVWDDDRREEPYLAAGAVALGLFAFALTWPYHAVVGSTGALLACAAIVVAPFLESFWSDYPWHGSRGLVLVGGLVALDDVVEHAFGVPTPLDHIWVHGIAPLLPHQPI